MYLKKVMVNHSWDTPTTDDGISCSRPIEPMTLASLVEMYNSEGPKEGTPEHASLEKQMGFGYRSLLGELLYAYVICQPDIGYSLSHWPSSIQIQPRFIISTCPCNIQDHHCQNLK